MTSKYRFTDKSLKLGKGLIQGLVKFIDARKLECKSHHDNERIMHLLISLEAVFSEILDYYNNSLNQNLDDILDHDHLSFTEALLLLHGLYPSQCFDLKTTPESDDIDIYNHTFILNYFEGKSKVYADLSRAIIAGKESSQYGIQSDSKDGVYTEQFISWATNKGFIEHVDSQGKVSKDKETGIPKNRYTIYTQTLPEYLKQLKFDQPAEYISTNGLTVTDSGKEGKYGLKVLDTLGKGSLETIKADLRKLYKSTWWKSQPDEIRSKWQVKHK